MPVIVRYRAKPWVSTSGDAAFACRRVQCLEAERINTRCLPQSGLQNRIGYLLKRRSDGRERGATVLEFHLPGGKLEQAARVSQGEWHRRACSRVGFIVTHERRERWSRSTTSAARASNGSRRQGRSSGRGCHAGRSPQRGSAQLHALAYNLGNFLRTLATPEPIKDWSLTSLKEKLIKIGAKVVSHGATSHSRWPRSPSTANVPGDFAADRELRPQPPPAPA